MMDTPAGTPAAPEQNPQMVSSIEPEAPKCPNCGVQAEPGAAFCRMCGTKLPEAQAAAPAAPAASVKKPVNKKRLVVLLACILGGLIVLAGAAFAVLYFKPFMDPKQKTLDTLVSDLSSGKIESAYNDCFTDTYKKSVSLDDFKKQLTGMTFFTDIQSKKVTSDKDTLLAVFESGTKDKKTRAVVSVDKFEGGKIDTWSILELDKAIYGKSVDKFTSTAGELVLLIGYRSNNDYSGSRDFSSTRLTKDGDKIATPGVMGMNSSDKDGKLYTAYFSIKKEKITDGLSFSLKGFPDILLDGILVEQDPSSSKK